ncbi:MAG: amidohydrolase [bacterium JZ-2024 1]
MKALVNAKVFTPSALRGKEYPADCLLFSDKVEATGNYSTLKEQFPAGTKVYDCAGGYVLPGFIDAHTHLASWGSSLRYVDLEETSSIEEAVKRIQEGAKEKQPGEWLIAVRWDESRWKEGRYLTREELDVATLAHPVLAVRICGHIGVLNTGAFKALSLNPDDFPQGLVKEQVLDEIRRRVAPSAEMRKKDICTAAQMALSLGITCINEIAHLSDFELYYDLIREGDFPIRVYAIPLWEEWKEGGKKRIPEIPEWLWMRGIKLFADGSLGARTAKLRESYADAPGNGEWVLPPEELKEAIREILDADMQPVIHCIGDEAIEQVLQILEEFHQEKDLKRLRPRLEHFEMATGEQVERLKRLGGIASMQPNFVGRWGVMGGLYEKRLGSERARRMNPFLEVVLRECPLAFGSDMMPFSPLFGIRSTVFAPFLKQKLTEKQALLAYTSGSAYACFAENWLGSLEPGKKADISVWDKWLSEFPRLQFCFVNGVQKYPLE